MSTAERSRGFGVIYKGAVKFTS